MNPSSRIHAVFGKPTFEALNLLEERAVVKDISPSGRFIYKVFVVFLAHWDLD